MKLVEKKSLQFQFRRTPSAKKSAGNFGKYSCAAIEKIRLNSSQKASHSLQDSGKKKRILTHPTVNQLWVARWEILELHGITTWRHRSHVAGHWRMPAVLGRCFCRTSRSSSQACPAWKTFSQSLWKCGVQRLRSSARNWGTRGMWNEKLLLISGSMQVLKLLSTKCSKLVSTARSPRFCAHVKPVQFWLKPKFGPTDKGESNAARKEPPATLRRSPVAGTSGDLASRQLARRGHSPPGKAPADEGWRVQKHTGPDVASKELKTPQDTLSKQNKNRWDHVRWESEPSINRLQEQPGDLLNLFLNSSCLAQTWDPKHRNAPVFRATSWSCSGIPFEIHGQRLHENAILQTRLGYLISSISETFLKGNRRECPESDRPVGRPLHLIEKALKESFAIKNDCNEILMQNQTSFGDLRDRLNRFEQHTKWNSIRIEW